MEGRGKVEGDAVKGGVCRREGIWYDDECDDEEVYARRGEWSCDTDTPALISEWSLLFF